MIRGEVQYIADTLLIEKLAVLEAGLSKRAGFVDSLSGIAGSLVSSIQNEVREKGVFFVLADVFITGRLFKTHWFLVVINEIARMFGFDVVSILRNIWNTLKPKVEAGESLTLSDVNQVTFDAAGVQMGGMLDVHSSADLFYPIRKLDISGKLFK